MLHGVLVDHRVVAMRQRGDEMVHVRRTRRCLHLGIGGVELAVSDIVAHRAVEQPRVLQHHAEHRAQVVAREVADIVAAYLDGARLHVVEAHEQLHHRGLAGAGGSHERHGLALGHARREVLDDGFSGL